MNDIKVKLRTLRAELNVTQEKFANLIGMPSSTYRKKETGESPFTIEEAFIIAQVTNKSIEEIFLK